jgi:single-strand DNA-binding protein
MSRSLNKVMIIGYLGREPEMRYTSSGKAVTTFSVATNRGWSTPGGERREETEWFTVVAWGSLAEICKQHLSKGAQVYIEGRLQTRRWEDAEGKKHAAVEVVAAEMIQLGEKKEGAGSAESRAAPSEEEYPF